MLLHASILLDTGVMNRIANCAVALFWDLSWICGVMLGCCCSWAVNKAAVRCNGAVSETKAWPPTVLPWGAAEGLWLSMGEPYCSNC